MKVEGMIVKDFRGEHRHRVGDQCKMGEDGKRKPRAKLLACLIDGKMKLVVDHSIAEIIKDLQLELGITLSYMQSWRAREYVRMLVMGKPVDQYKMLSWMCVAIVRANADSRAFVELDGCRFMRKFLALGPCMNGFILGSRKMLFVDGTHLSEPYEATMLAAIALDPDNHIFVVAYAVVALNWSQCHIATRDCLLVYRRYLGRRTMCTMLGM